MSRAYHFQDLEGKYAGCIRVNAAGSSGKVIAVEGPKASLLKRLTSEDMTTLEGWEEKGVMLDKVVVLPAMSALLAKNLWDYPFEHGLERGTPRSGRRSGPQSSERALAEFGTASLYFPNKLQGGEDALAVTERARKGGYYAPHKGRPGQVGGSAPRDGGAEKVEEEDEGYLKGKGVPAADRPYLHTLTDCFTVVVYPEDVKHIEYRKYKNYVRLQDYDGHLGNIDASAENSLLDGWLRGHGAADTSAGGFVKWLEANGARKLKRRKARRPLPVLYD